MLEALPGIAIDIGVAPSEIEPDWPDLTTRAGANIFMDPTVIGAALATRSAGTLPIAAWERTRGSEKLVGVWALRVGKGTPLGPTILSAPAYDYSFQSDPVLDSGHVDDVVAALLNAIAGDRSLPKVIRLRHLDGDSDTYRALTKALAARGSRRLVLAERKRAFASGEAGVKSSGSTRKKLRQDWKHLSAEGSVEIVNDRTPAAVAAAFEVFLVMEAASWKAGSAILATDRSAAFARKTIADLAAKNAASVAMLTLDGRPIATQVLLYCGRMAFTWKTAFDAGYGRHSPGALLVDRITADLLASGDVDAIESCSPDGGFMEQMWTGRRSTIDLLVDLGERPSLAFAVVAAWARGFAAAKVLRNAWRARRAARRQRPRLATAMENRGP